ncbi:MAG: hypothetical protein Q7N50_03230, partial [Armatimonadota bacterium]|nr:hypothetical protein [Armatimonadota bacterium]
MGEAAITALLKMRDERLTAFKTRRPGGQPSVTAIERANHWAMAATAEYLAEAVDALESIKQNQE